jgi:hypothetical protein
MGDDFFLSLPVIRCGDARDLATISAPRTLLSTRLIAESIGEPGAPKLRRVRDGLGRTSFSL